MRPVLRTLGALCFLFVTKAQAANGGDIIYRHVSGLTWEFEVRVAIDPSEPTDQPELLASVNGSADTIPRTNIEQIAGACANQIDTYIWQHTLPGPGVYEVRAWKLTRPNNLENLPNGSSQWLGLSAMLIVVSGMENSSPVFGSDQNELEFSASSVIHDPLVTDPDGDSLSFELVTPLGTAYIPVPGYQQPDIATPPGDLISFSSTAGVYEWAYPNMIGAYSLAIRCNEWRNGIQIGSMLRDMVICLDQLPNSVDETHRDGQLQLITSWQGEALNIDVKGGSPVMVQLFDISGRSIIQRSFSQPTLLLPSTGLAKGCYLVCVVFRDGRIASVRTVRQ